MIPWLDFKLFGNGRGLAQPFFNGQFYWLVDERTQRGTFYRFSWGLGAQLTSLQWRHPLPGERRQLLRRTFHPFNSSRTGPRVMVSWAMSLPEDINEAHAAIQKLKDDVQRGECR
jgi:hypothetical protein